MTPVRSIRRVRAVMTSSAEARPRAKRIKPNVRGLSASLKRYGAALGRPSPTYPLDALLAATGAAATAVGVEAAAKAGIGECLPARISSAEGSESHAGARRAFAGTISGLGPATAIVLSRVRGAGQQSHASRVGTTPDRPITLSLLFVFTSVGAAYGEQYSLSKRRQA